MRKLLVLSLITVMMAATSAAQAGTKSKGVLHIQLARYYHADGFIKSIGHVAFRTIYSSNAKKREAWKAKLHHLVLVRASAFAKIEAIRTPPQPALPPHYGSWMCIHRFEGSWTDSGSPFWGGLQMNWDFMATYGAKLLREKGTADHWTPLEQMWVAENAWQARGFYPWPNTARYCGLI